MKYLKKVLPIVFLALISFGLSCSCQSQGSPQKEVQTIDNQEFKMPVQCVSNTTVGDRIDFTQAAEMSVNAVVHVMVSIENQAPAAVSRDPFFDFFFRDGREFRQPQPRMGSGSGVILSPDGYIVTNNHVVENADKITVTLNDKRTFDATLVGADPSTDLALLKIDATDLPTLAIGNSDELKVGEWVLAVGNPFNLTSTVTAGIVSAKARNINILSGDMKIESFIQTDAAVNPGNSGGALVNTSGQLVGINTAIASQTGSYSGYAFAIPVSIVSKVVSDLKQYGVVQRALLGVVINDINAEFAKSKNISLLEGVYVSEVNEQSGAKEAGIEKGDIITHANGVQVKSVAQLQEQIGRFRPGDKVKIQVNRNGQKKEFAVTLKNTMGDTGVVKQVGMTDLGATFAPVSEKQKREFGIPSGLVVEKVEKNGRFAQAGIPKGYIIVKVNNSYVNSVSDIEQIMKEVKQGRNNEQALFISGVNPSGKVVYYAVDLN